ncbi:hypothetical protein [Fluviicola sp.]|uniref:hypothetical protein n=1 Tax=Fluviicola sp. TaxID=1917219 RepID=UPI003D267BE9
MITLLCVGLVAVSMFLPVYETWIRESEIHRQVGIGIYKVYDIDNTYVSVHNGFGSFYAVVSCFITFLLAIGILLLPRESTIPIIAVIVYVLSVILVRLGTISLGRPFGDNMLIGFYLILLSQTLLIIFSFYKYRRLKEEDRYLNR